MLADSAILIVCKVENKKLWGWILQKTIWWWQFGCSNGWIPECITKLSWDVKIKSMQELIKLCAGYFIIWLKLNWEVHISILNLLKVIISFWYQPCNLTLKSPNTIIKNGLLLTMCSKLSQIHFLGDLERLTNSHVSSPILTSKLIHSWLYDTSVTFRGKKHFWYRQTHPRLVFEGWSILGKLKPGICKLLSHFGV